MTTVFELTAVKNGVKHEFSYQPLDQKSFACVGESLYVPSLPEALDVFTQVVSKITEMQNPVVKRQALDILDRIYICLFHYSQSTNLSNRLPKLHLTIDMDDAVYIEWNFQNFRFGFTLEPEKENSSFYFVSGDLTEGSITSTSDKLGLNYRPIVDKIVKYALENT